MVVGGPENRVRGLAICDQPLQRGGRGIPTFAPGIIRVRVPVSGDGVAQRLDQEVPVDSSAFDEGQQYCLDR